MSFRIPNLEELSVGESTIAHAIDGEQVAEVTAAAPPSGGSEPSLAVAAHAPAKEQQIEFLCPNGHHLHGPATLQGRAGECPECGSRFRIPIIDEPELEDPEPLLEPQLAGEAEIPLVDEISLYSGVRSAQAAADGAEPLEFLQVLDAPEMGPGGISARAGMHPLAALFIELWAARDEGSRVEVHLESGSVLVPDGYLKSHSIHDHAVLVAKDPDGRSTVTIVPWNSIARIILRALKDVPGEVVR